ncbi:MAG: hypothetical protein OEZ48_03475 [Candidatus Bathyarchaeota archaeon]|nr:hypothetical protein [Candidatus Bathyarchaeota archaeon]MDH5686908.1 hypothetical protein [Candidatus Bathyarchaeota archaeon]
MNHSITLNWKDLSRDERTDLVAQLYQKHKSVRKVADLLDLGPSTVEEYLIYGRVPQELRDRFSMLSLEAFVRASRRGRDLEQQLEKENIKKAYNKSRRRLRGIKTQIKLTREEIADNTESNGDKRELRGLINRLNKLLDKLDGLDDAK